MQQFVKNFHEKNQKAPISCPKSSFQPAKIAPEAARLTSRQSGTGCFEAFHGRFTGSLRGDPNRPNWTFRVCSFNTRSVCIKYAFSLRSSAFVRTLYGIQSQSGRPIWRDYVRLQSTSYSHRAQSNPTFNNSQRKRKGRITQVDMKPSGSGP